MEHGGNQADQIDGGNPETGHRQRETRGRVVRPKPATPERLNHAGNPGLEVKPAMHMKHVVNEEDEGHDPRDPLQRVTDVGRIRISAVFESPPRMINRPMIP